MIVRQAARADWAALRDVRLAALADAPAAFASTLDAEREFDDAEWQRRAGASPWFAAWAGTEPVGLVVVLVPDAARPGWQLVSMWASPQVRGRGVADQLVAAATGYVREQGGTRVTLWVADENERAQGFYRRAGFRPTGNRQAYRRADGSTLAEAEFALDL
ncbi:MAG: GNAT family N-acetyltransferase [Actinobacteria bacterium]|nr:GNAT family N-acetyltransferase [Actinomycetota bacterium]